MSTQERHLAAILFTDIVGYTAMMQKDEFKAVSVIKHYHEVLEKSVATHRGEILNNYGDGSLCSFSSVLEAINCAIELQRSLQLEPAVPLRIGLHVGEIFFEKGKVLGDGVNIASRIQSLGTSNSILLSSEINNKIKNQPEFKTLSLGSFHFKNVDERIEVFALTNDGLTVPDKNKMEGKLEFRESSRKKRMIVVAFVGAFALTAIMALYFFYKSRNEIAKADRSVAVLAFNDFSVNKDQEWFSDGLTEEILNSLTNLHELKVTARTSTFYFKGKDLPLQEIAEKLGVAYVVAGSVQRIDNQLRITAQLIRAKDGFHIWSHKYDRTSEDLFRVQTDIAENIALVLLRELTPEKQAKLITNRPINIEAYEYYLKGYRAHQEKFQYTTLINHFEEAEENLLKAISLDPSYGEAYGELADLYDTRGNDARDKTKFWHLRDSVMQIGYRLNPNSTTTLIVYAYSLRKRDQPNLDSSFNCIKKAYQLAPNSVHVIRSMSGFYRDIGLVGKSKIFTHKALVLDPLNIVSLNDLADEQMTLGTYDDAKKTLEKVLELDSEHIKTHYMLGVISLYQGDIKDVVYHLEIIRGIKGIRSDHYRVNFLQALLFAKEGKRAEALKLNSGFVVMSFLGMKKEFLAKLDSISKTYIQTIDPTSLLKNPVYDFVRDDPKFKTILDREKKEYEVKLAKYGKLD